MTVLRTATLVAFSAIAIFFTHCSDSDSSDIVQVTSTSSVSFGEDNGEQELLKLYESIDLLMENIDLYDSMVTNESDPSRKALLQKMLSVKVDSFELQRDFFVFQLDSLYSAREISKAKFVALGDTLSEEYRSEQDRVERMRLIKQASEKAFAEVVPVALSSSFIPVSSSSVVSSAISGSGPVVDSVVNSQSSETVVNDSTIFLTSSSAIKESSSMALSSVILINTAPVIDTTIVGAVNSVEDSVISFVVRANDLEGDSLEWDISVDSTWGAILVISNSDSSIVTFTPTAHKNGLVPMNVRVSDGALGDSLAVTIAIAPVNDAPEYLGPATLVGVMRDTKTIEINTGAACVDTLDGASGITRLSTYWYRDANEQGYDGDSLAVVDSLLLTALDVSHFIYAVVHCMDAEGAVAIQKTPYSSKVDHRPNNAPVIIEGPLLAITHNEDAGLHSQTINATDSDNDSLVWVIIAQPAQGTIAYSDKKNNSAVVDLSGVPQHFNGVLTAVVEVRDPFDADTLTLSYTIQPVNDQPVITGDVLLKGNAVVTQELTLDSVTFECYDTYDSQNASSVGVTWYRDDVCGSYGVHNPLVADTIYTLAVQDEGSCLFVITSCTDSDGSVVYDTSGQSARVAAAPVFNQERLLKLERAHSEYALLPGLDLNPLNGGVLTIEAWVKWNGLQGQNERIVEFSNSTVLGSSKDNIVIYHRDGDSRLRISVNNGNWGDLESPNGFIVPGVWTHVAVVFSAASIDNVTIYKNGEVVEVGTLSNPIQVERAYNFIGGSAFQNDDTFDGFLENMRVWNSVRTQQEIIDNMLQDFGGLTHSSHLVASYDFRRAASVPVLIENRVGNSLGTIINGIGNDGDEWVAEFETYRLTVNGQTGGAVTPNSDVVLVEGQQYSIEAVPDPGYQFSEWVSDGNAVVDNATRMKTQVTVLGNTTVTAEFVEQYTVSISSDGNCALQFEGDTVLSHGDQLELNAYATTNSFIFSEWIVTGAGGAVFSDPSSPNTQVSVNGDVSIEPRYLRRHELIFTIHPFAFQDGCVVNKYGKSQNGENVETERCTGVAKERWKTQNDGSYFALRNEAVQPANSYIIMDADAGQGPNVHIWGHTKGQERHSGQFLFKPLSDGSYTIKLRENSNKCLEVYGPNPYNKNVFLDWCDSSNSQKWMIKLYSK